MFVSKEFLLLLVQEIEKAHETPGANFIIFYNSFVTKWRVLPELKFERGILGDRATCCYAIVISAWKE